MLTEIEYRLLQEGQRLLRYAAKSESKIEVSVLSQYAWPEDEPLPDYRAIDKDGQYTFISAIQVRARAETALPGKHFDERLWEIKLDFVMSDGAKHQAFSFLGKGDLEKDMKHMSMATLSEYAAILARFVSETIDKAKPHD